MEYVYYFFPAVQMFAVRIFHSNSEKLTHPYFLCFPKCKTKMPLKIISQVKTTFWNSFLLYCFHKHYKHNQLRSRVNRYLSSKTYHYHSLVPPLSYQTLSVKEIYVDTNKNDPLQWKDINEHLLNFELLKNDKYLEKESNHWHEILV